MTNPIDAGFPARRSRRLWPPADLRFLNRPSFASALRQRGLLARAIQPAGFDTERSASADSWITEASIAVTSIYEAHQRRLAMEQALAVLRGDAAGA